MPKKTLYSFITLLVVTATLLSACGTPVPVTVAPTKKVQAPVVTATPEPPKRQLEIFHWWTASGEVEAADAMFAALANTYPDIEVVANPVEGGGGTELRTVLKARVNAGMAPDTFQTTGGAELKAYVDNNVLVPLDAFYAENDYGNKIPKPLLNAVSINGHPYSVPLNMHLENILYYNKKLFDELKLTVPTGYDELVAACEVIQKAKPGMSCLAIGSKDNWSDVFVLDTIMLELGGPEYYVRFFKGEIDPATDDILRQSLERFAALQKYSNMSDHSSLTWDQAVALVAYEQAAMTIMGTWAIGTFTKGLGWEPGVDFGAASYPMKPERILLFHPDTYGCSVVGSHPVECQDWLSVVASSDLQLPADIIQGGLFARTDIDPKEFPDPIRQELQSYVSEHPDKLILDQHGSILPNDAQTQYRGIISFFLAAKEPDIDFTISAIAGMMITFKVREEATWYQWP